MKTKRSGSRSTWLSNHAWRCFNIRAILLGGVRRLFLCVIRRRSKKRHSVPMATASRALSSSSRHVTSLRKGRGSTRRGPRSDASGDPRPGLGRHVTLPRSNARQRIALDALTPNRSAAARHDNPPAIAPTTRRRRSTDKALAMQASLLAGIQHESEPSRFGNPPRFNQTRKRLRYSPGRSRISTTPSAGGESISIDYPRAGVPRAREEDELRAPVCPCDCAIATSFSMSFSMSCS